MRPSRSSTRLAVPAFPDSMTNPVDLAKLARAIETELERTGSPERAAGEKRYLKSDMYFLGATLADIRRVAWKAATDSGLERWDCAFASDARWIGGLATTTSGSDGRRCSRN